tara:strand:- start:860 stop:1363 length:504 start_codon:yes stop_codon:yes gene_type:complete
MKDLIKAIKNDFPGSDDLSDQAKEGLSIFSNDLEDAYSRYISGNKIIDVGSVDAYGSSKGEIISDVAAGSYNYIPSTVGGKCHSLLIVEALGTSGSANGFNKRMLDVVDVWLKCGNNKITIIITKDWSETHFNSWLRIIETYKKTRSAECYILQYTEHTKSLSLKFS